ncbi:MAG: META domain-containing protein [Anaerolineales bacterium]|nr:META domain-containing protein [Anaerolineales bacterium]
MKKRLAFVISLALLAAVVLVACGGNEESTEKTIFVSPTLVDCQGVVPQKCLQVKETPDGEYTLFYDTIEGFNFEEGYEYELVVREEQVENPPADASSVRWVLVEEVSKTPAAGTTAGTDAGTTAGTDAGAPTSKVTTFYVGPTLVDCQGVAPQKCLQVREDPNAEYSLFYSTIEGFNFEEGYEYIIRVQVDPVPNPPADASAFRYTLVEELSKTPAGAAPADTTPVAALEEVLWGLVSYVNLNGETVDALPDSQVTAQFSAGQVTGSAGCNNYFAGYELNGDALTIGPAGSTQMFCEPAELMDQESAFLAALQSTASYKLDAGQLILSNADGGVVVTFQPIQPVSLEEGTWRLTGYNNGREAFVGVLEEAEITAQFSNGQVSGSAGCNTYSGTYEIQADQITIGQPAATLMFCSEPEGVMDQETAYLAALVASTSFKITGDVLELFDANGVRMLSFEVMPAGTLEGPTWTLTGFNNGQGGFVSVLIGSEITAEFADGSVSGSAGCNQYNASYEVDGNNVTFGLAITTRMFCGEPEGVMDQETQYLAALQSAVSYEITGDTLEMYNADGVRMVSFAAAQPEEALPLTGTAWVLAAFMDAQSSIDPLEGSEITMQFGEDGQVGGVAGCNNYFASYTVNGSELTLGPAGATLRSCDTPEGVMLQENMFLAALDDVASFQIEGRVLTLFNADGVAILLFAAPES